MELKVKLDEGAILPDRAHEDDAGLDLFSREDVTVRLKESVTIDTGVHVAIPKGYVGFIKSKSGLMVKHSILTDGTVDADGNPVTEY
jgi:dUTP pyrophosphatase